MIGAVAFALLAPTTAPADDDDWGELGKVEAMPDPAPGAAEQEARGARRSASRGAPVHLAATGLGEFVSRQAGAEVGASFALGRMVDVGAAATLGRAIGGRVTVSVHPARAAEHILQHFLQLRGVIHPVPVASGTAVGLGGGAWVGGTLEAGPGRFAAGVMGEVYSGPQSCLPAALLAAVGYEVDLLAPAVERVVVERERVVEVVRDRPVPAPAMALFRGRVTDLEDKPLNATLSFPGAVGDLAGKKYDAAPTYEIRLGPGEYYVEANVSGYLIRGRRVAIAAGETVVYDFQLRPAPTVKSAELTKERIEIKQMIQFAFKEARILPQSFPVLDEVVDILLRSPAIQIRIEGHTDDVGGPDFNQRLSDARAKAVVKYLLDWGIAPSRLTAVGFGLTKPIASNKTDPGRAKNRRVQFEITGQ